MTILGMFAGCDNSGVIVNIGCDSFGIIVNIGCDNSGIVCRYCVR